MQMKNVTPAEQFNCVLLGSGEERDEHSEIYIIHVHTNQVVIYLDKSGVYLMFFLSYFSRRNSTSAI